jgi:hypothetical protein
VVGIGPYTFTVAEVGFGEFLLNDADPTPSPTIGGYPSVGYVTKSGYVFKVIGSILPVSELLNAVLSTPPMLYSGSPLYPVSITTLLFHCTINLSGTLCALYCNKTLPVGVPNVTDCVIGYPKNPLNDEDVPHGMLVILVAVGVGVGAGVDVGVGCVKHSPAVNVNP